MKKFLTQKINFAYALVVMLALVLGVSQAAAVSQSYGPNPGEASFPLIHRGGGDQVVQSLQFGGCSGPSCSPLGAFDARAIANAVSYFTGSSAQGLFYVLNDTNLLGKVYIGSDNGQPAGPNMDLWANSHNGMQAPLQRLNVAGNVAATNLINDGGNPKVCFNRAGDLVLCSVAAAVDGACGSSDGGAFNTAPTTNLCAAGNASDVDDNGLNASPRFTWLCYGENGGQTASCSAETAPITGQCADFNNGPYSSQPANPFNGCQSGVYEDIDEAEPWDGNAPWHWKCNGRSGGLSENCTADRAAIPTPICHNWPDTYTTQPATNDATGCDVGSFTDLTNGSNQWNWRCSEGGSNTTCHADRAADNPHCESYPGYNSAQPATNTATGCTNGTFLEEDDSEQSWQWSCQKNGINQSCSAAKYPKVYYCHLGGQGGSWTIESGAICDTPNMPGGFKWEQIRLCAQQQPLADNCEPEVGTPEYDLPLGPSGNNCTPAGSGQPWNCPTT